MKPYAFPEMSTGEAAEAKRQADAETIFERLFCDANENLSANDVLNGDAASNKEQDLKSLEEQAYLKGFENGQKDGLDSVREKIEVVIKSFSEALLEFKRLEKKLYLDCEKQGVDLAIAIAKKIVHKEIATDRKIISNVIKEAIKKVAGNGKIKIRMSPDDLQFMHSVKSQIADLLADFEKVTFEGDERIVSGGCIIDTDIGDIDARIDKQIQAVEELFNAEIKKMAIGGS